MASETIITTILERKVPYLSRRPTGDEFDSVVADYVQAFRGTNADLLSAGVDQWFHNQPSDRIPPALPRPDQLWPLINRDRTESHMNPTNRAARFVPMPANVRAQLDLLKTAWSVTASPETRRRAAEHIQELAAPLDTLADTRACRCIGGWIYEGGQTYPAAGPLCDRRVYPCKEHNPVAFGTWLDQQADG